MKKFLTALSLCAACVALNAAESYVSVGASYLNTRNELKDGEFDLGYHKANVGEAFVKLGKKLGNEKGLNSHRLYIAYAYQMPAKVKDVRASDHDKEDDYYPLISYRQADAKISKFEWSAHKVSVGYDWAPNISSNLKAFVGVYGGAARVSLDKKYTLTTSGTDYNIATGATTNVAKSSRKIEETSSQIRGFFGANAGLLYELSRNVAVELGVKAEFVEPELKNVGGSLGLVLSF